MFYYAEKEGPIHHFAFDDIIKDPQHSISVNFVTGYIALLSIRDDRPVTIAEDQFTSLEIRIIVPIFLNYPHYCPYEVLHASYTTGNVFETSIQHSRRTLEDAMRNDCWDLELRALRGTLSRARMKIKKFGIDFGAILSTGYQLQKVSQKFS